jgi:hypothetical protein
MNTRRKRVERIDIELSDNFSELFATSCPVSLDMPGILFVEAGRLIRKGSRNLEALKQQLAGHQARAVGARPSDQNENTWTDLIHSASRLETLLAHVVRDFAVADVLLVGSAEAYVNVIAGHVLPSSERDHFDKLTPTGKWLFLPKIMKLSWKPKLSSGDLQNFAAVVARRNRVVHPKRIAVAGVTDVHQFADRLSLNADLAKRGLSSVAGLVRAMSMSWRGSSGPDWLRTENARSRPPCLIFGLPDSPGRLGRGRTHSRPD